MITLLTGATGSGKTYRAVSEIIKLLNIPKKVFSNIKLNIDDPNYNYIDEIEVRKFLDEIEKAFNNSNLEEAKQKYLSSKYAFSTIVLDEVQFLGFRAYNKSVSDWLTLHRHFSQDVILITQVVKNLAPIYQDLCHRHIEYQSPTNRIMSSHFQYSEFDAVKGEKIKTRVQKPDKRIFEIYKTGKAEGGTHPLMIKLTLVVTSLVAMVSFLVFSDKSIVNVVKEKTKKIDNNITYKKEITLIKKIEKKDIPKETEEHNITEECEMVREDNLKRCDKDYVWCTKTKNGYMQVKKVCTISEVK